MVVEPNLLDLF